jgi:hypothetical protein
LQAHILSCPAYLAVMTDSQRKKEKVEGFFYSFRFFSLSFSLSSSLIKLLDQ